MNREDKISFLKALSLIDKKIDIKKSIVLKLSKNLQGVGDKEQIIYDLLGGLENNDEFLTEIIGLKSLDISNIIKQINLLKNNYINEKYAYLIKLLVKNKSLDTAYSEHYITEFMKLVNNQKKLKFETLSQEIVFDKNLIDLFYIHFLNLYFNGNDYEKFIKDKEVDLKTIISFYIYASQKITHTKELLVSLSIITIFAKIYDQFIEIDEIERVDIADIFKIVFECNTLYDNLEKSLRLLKEIDYINVFLEELNSNLKKSNSIQNKYYIEKFINLVLKIILEKSLYTDETLVSFCSLFSSNEFKEEYKKIIDNKTKKDKDWYEKYVLENLSSNNDLQYETLKFLGFVENWQNNSNIENAVKERF